MSTQRVIWVVNPTGKEHAYVRTPMIGDGSICGRTTYQGDYCASYPDAAEEAVCRLCERRAVWDGRDWTWDDSLNNNKENSMATAKTTKKPDNVIIAEELLAAAERHNLCRQFYTEMKKINEKLEVKLPEELLTPGYRATLYFNDNSFKWTTPPQTKAGDVPQKSITALEKHLSKALQEALASWDGGGTITGDPTVYIEEIYEHY